MAISKQIALPGGFTATAYLFIRSVQFDKVTGGILAEVWSFPSEAERRACSEAWQNLTTIALTVKPSVEIAANGTERPSRGPLVARRVATDAVDACNPGALHINVRLTPEEAAPAVKDGAVDIPALYELLKREGGPLYGGQDA